MERTAELPLGNMPNIGPNMGKNMGKHTKHGPSEFEDFSLLNLKSQERDVPEQLQRRPARTVGGGNKRRPKWMMSSDPQKDNR